jgi:hypothetical protein
MAECTSAPNAGAGRRRPGAQASIHPRAREAIIDQLVSISQLLSIAGILDKVIIYQLLSRSMGFYFTTLTGSGTAGTKDIVHCSGVRI